MKQDFRPLMGQKEEESDSVNRLYFVDDSIDCLKNKKENVI